MSSGEPNAQLLEEIKEMIRRDLKLGATATIADDMPLVGSDIDIDSLDILLLVTNLEKRYGIKIASEDVGQEVFQTLQTLAAFVETKIGSRDAGGATAQAAPAADYLAMLPHGEPFRFITRVVRIDAGVEGEGIWSLGGQEDFFRGHFPGQPLVPGVLIAEALAQLSGIVGGAAGGARQRGKLAQVNVRFNEAVAPPADLQLKSKLTSTLGLLRQFEVQALHAGRKVAEGTLAIAYAPAPREIRP